MLDVATPAPYRPPYADLIRRELHRPALAGHFPYALLRKPEDATVMPLVFSCLEALARGIHRDRGDCGIELVNAPLRLRNESWARDGVAIFIQGEDGARRSYLGWAWLNGRGREALEAALFAAQPIVAAA